MSEAKPVMGVIRKAALIAALPLLLHACADDISGVVDVYVAKGPISGSECKLYRADNDALLAGPKTTSGGSASFGNVAFAGVAYVTCTGGTYTSEATGNTVDASNLTLRAAKWFSGGTTFVVTPVTEIAVRKANAASGGLEANIRSTNRSVADDFGISTFDITSVQPTDLNAAQAQDDPPGWYAIVLAGISQYAADIPTSIANAIDALAAEDNMANSPLVDALNNLAGNSNVQSNIDAGVVNAIVSGLGNNPDTTPGQAGSPSTTSFTVTKISPITGDAAGGTSLTITGANFEAGSNLALVIGGNNATNVTVKSSTEIIATAPAGAVTGSTVDVVVTNGNGNVATLASAFTYVADPDAPTIRWVSPANGPATGGTVLTITGTNYQEGAVLAVSIGGNAATSVTVKSATEMTAIIPAGTAGPAVAVVVTNGDGKTVTEESAFTYIDSPAGAPTITTVAPASGSEVGGTNLTITGTNYTPGASLGVTIGGVAATGVTVDSATQITAVSPPNSLVDNPQDVVVTNGDGETATSIRAFTYISEPPPTIRWISPANGPAAGGTVLTIIGTNYKTGTSLAVSMDGNPATNVTVKSATEMTAIVPAGTAGSTVSVIVTNGDNRTVTANDAFSYTTNVPDAPTITTVAPASGSEVGGTSLTITGSNYVDGTSLGVSIGGVAATGVSVDSATQITAVSPPNTLVDTPRDVVVTNGNGETATSIRAFTYQKACQNCELDANGCPF